MFTSGGAFLEAILPSSPVLRPDAPSVLTVQSWHYSKVRRLRTQVRRPCSATTRVGGLEPRGPAIGAAIRERPSTAGRVLPDTSGPARVAARRGNRSSKRKRLCDRELRLSIPCKRSAGVWAIPCMYWSTSSACRMLVSRAKTLAVCPRRSLLRVLKPGEKDSIRAPLLCQEALRVTKDPRERDLAHAPLGGPALRPQSLKTAPFVALIHGCNRSVSVPRSAPSGICTRRRHSPDLFFWENRKTPRRCLSQCARTFLK